MTNSAQQDQVLTFAQDNNGLAQTGEQIEEHSQAAAAGGGAARQCKLTAGLHRRTGDQQETGNNGKRGETQQHGLIPNESQENIHK